MHGSFGDAVAVADVDVNVDVNVDVDAAVTLLNILIARWEAEDADERIKGRVVVVLNNIVRSNCNLSEK